MNAQHTPGPWQTAKNAREWSVERDALGSTQSVAICDDDGKIVAFAVDYSNRAFADLNTDHARLIAAAPELLAALNRIADMCAAPPNFSDKTIQDVACAAIAKATGGGV